jgi:hypothetical protein
VKTLPNLIDKLRGKSSRNGIEVDEHEENPSPGVGVETSDEFGASAERAEVESG